MKKSFVLMLVLLLMVSVIGLTSISAKTITIAMIPKSLDNPVFLDSKVGGQEEAKKLGVEFIWTGSNQADAASQVTVIEGLIQKKVDGMVISCNDAGALKQSNVGIAISDDSNSFTPSSDVIMNGEKVSELDRYLNVCKGSITIVKLTFLISFLYNVVGLTFAVTGKMNPLFAALIMPASSITVISFTTVSTWILGKKYFKKQA